MNSNRLNYGINYRECGTICSYNTFASVKNYNGNGRLRIYNSISTSSIKNRYYDAQKNRTMLKTLKGLNHKQGFF